MTTYIGLAISDTMFAGNVLLSRSEIDLEEFRYSVANGGVSCVNRSHYATINALRERFQVELDIPAEPPIVHLEIGDSLLICSIRNLPRLQGRHEYTDKEIAKAEFAFARYDVKPIP